MKTAKATKPKSTPKSKRVLGLKRKSFGRLVPALAVIAAVAVGAAGYYVYDAQSHAGSTYLFANQGVTASACKTRINTSRGVAYNVKVLYTKAPKTANVQYRLTIGRRQSGTGYWGGTRAQLSDTAYSGNYTQVGIGTKTVAYNFSQQLPRFTSC